MYHLFDPPSYTPTGVKVWSGISSEEFVCILDEQLTRLVESVESGLAWDLVTSPESSPDLVESFMREVYLEITSYQPHVIEASIAAIGQMPRSINPKLIGHLLKHQAEEWDHGEMAMRDYSALGGNESNARRHRPSPAAFAMASVWRMMAHMRDPFAFVGALYPLESLTPIVSERVSPYLIAKGFDENALEFMKFHAIVDPKHSKLIRHLIKQLVTSYPDSKEAIYHGMACLLQVYPLPIWESAASRVMSTMEQAHCQ